MGDVRRHGRAHVLGGILHRDIDGVIGCHTVEHTVQDRIPVRPRDATDVLLVGEQRRQRHTVEGTPGLDHAALDAQGHVVAGIPLITGVIPDLGDGVKELPVELGMAGDRQEISIVDRQASAAAARRLVQAVGAQGKPGRAIAGAGLHVGAHELDAPIAQTGEGVRSQFIVMAQHVPGDRDLVIQVPLGALCIVSGDLRIAPVTHSVVVIEPTAAGESVNGRRRIPVIDQRLHLGSVIGIHVVQEKAEPRLEAVGGGVLGPPERPGAIVDAEGKQRRHALHHERLARRPHQRAPHQVVQPIDIALDGHLGKVVRAPLHRPALAVLTHDDERHPGSSGHHVAVSRRRHTHHGHAATQPDGLVGLVARGDIVQRRGTGPLGHQPDPGPPKYGVGARTGQIGVLHIDVKRAVGDTHRAQAVRLVLIGTTRASHRVHVMRLGIRQGVAVIVPHVATGAGGVQVRKHLIVTAGDAAAVKAHDGQPIVLLVSAGHDRREWPAAGHIVKLGPLPVVDDQVSRIDGGG